MSADRSASDLAELAKSELDRALDHRSPLPANDAAQKSIAASLILVAATMAEIAAALERIRVPLVVERAERRAELERRVLDLERRERQRSSA